MHKHTNVSVYIGYSVNDYGISHILKKLKNSKTRRGQRWRCKCTCSWAIWLSLSLLCLVRPPTSTNTHLQSLHRHSATIFLLRYVILSPWLPSKLLLKHISSTLLTYTSRHWQSSIGVSDSLFCDIWRQLNKFMLIDWAYDEQTI